MRRRKNNGRTGKKAKNVVGIDSSQNMIDYANKQFPIKQYPKLSFHKIDAQDLPFKNQFDIVFSNATLHWVMDHPAVLSGIRDALKENGMLYLSFGGKGNIGDVSPIAEKLQQEDPFKPYFKHFRPCWYFPSDKNYKRLLSNAGLQAISVKLVNREARHHSIDELEGYIRTSWHQYLNYLPTPDLKKQFTNELVKRYLHEHPTNENEESIINMVRLEVIARKNQY